MMSRRVLMLVLSVVLCSCTMAGAFQVSYFQRQPTRKILVFKNSNVHQVSPFLDKKFRQQTLIYLSDEDSDVEQSAKPKKRRTRKRRKETVQEATSEESTPAAVEPVQQEEPETPPPPAPTMELKPRDDSPVQLQVQNVKAVVTGSAVSDLQEAAEVAAESSSTIGDSSLSGSSSSPQMGGGSSTGSSSDSFEQLLADAREMKSLQEDDGDDEEEGVSIPETVGKVLSTIVTIDFFVVCGFLVWFLAGIFCSSVLKDDTVQIAFNNNFETLVQPALGILMIAAIGGNFFKGEEEEYDL